MNRITKVATALTIAGALAVSAATPTFARNGRIAAGVIGFAAGTMLGAAAASSHNGAYYDGAYAYEPGYAYQPSYGYESGYAYEPGYAYQPAPQYYRSYNRDLSGCTSEGPQGRPDTSACSN